MERVYLVYLRAYLVQPGLYLFGSEPPGSRASVIMIMPARAEATPEVREPHARKEARWGPLSGASHH
ncbi:MAG: hypothetical protein ACOX18_06185, partial [Bacillota bacterium]